MKNAAKTTKNVLFILFLCILMVMTANGAQAYASSDILVPGDKPFGDCDRVWFFNVSGGEFGSEMKGCGRHSL